MYGQIIKVTIFSIIKGIQLFSSNNWLSRKNAVPLQTEQTLLIWKKNTLNNTDVNLWSMVSGKWVFFDIIMLDRCVISSREEGKQDEIL